MIQEKSRVQALTSCDGKRSVQFEKGNVIYIGRRPLVEFDSNVCGHDGNGIGQPRRCWFMDWNKVKEVG